MRSDENADSVRERRDHRPDRPRVIEDVSARSRGAARIAPSTARERFVPSAQILKHLPVGLAVQRGGRLIRVNPRLLDLLGYTREVQVIGRPTLELIIPDDWPAALAQIQRAAFRGGEGGSELLRFTRSDGETVPLLVHVTLQSDGEIPVVIATCLAADTLPSAGGKHPEPLDDLEPMAPPTLLEVAEAIDEAAETEHEAVATLHHLLESGRIKRRP
jgi:PAS domain S-box-containing protein